MKNKPDPESVCPKHIDMFRELVECNDCNIYPQATINEHIKQAVLAERARCKKILEENMGVIGCDCADVFATAIEAQPHEQ